MVLNQWFFVLMILNLYSINVILITSLHCFLLLIMQMNLKSMSSKHLTITVIIDKEKDSWLPFLYVNIFHENGKFTTTKNNLQWDLYQL